MMRWAEKRMAKLSTAASIKHPSIGRNDRSTGLLWCEWRRPMMASDIDMKSGWQLIGVTLACKAAHSGCGLRTAFFAHPRIWPMATNGSRCLVQHKNKNGKNAKKRTKKQKGGLFKPTDKDYTKLHFSFQLKRHGFLLARQFIRNPAFNFTRNASYKVKLSYRDRRSIFFLSISISIGRMCCLAFGQIR